MLTEDYAKLSVTNDKELKASGATKLNAKQGTALMDAMGLDVDEDLGADLADDFADYDKKLQALPTMSCRSACCVYTCAQLVVVSTQVVVLSCTHGCWQDADQLKALADCLPSLKKAKQVDDAASVASRPKNTLENKMALEDHVA